METSSAVSVDWALPVLAALGLVLGEIAARSADAQVACAIHETRAHSCELCGAHLPMLASTSVVGWLAQRGRRACCGSRVGYRGTLVTTATTIAGVLLAVGGIESVCSLLAAVGALIAMALITAAAAVNVELLILPNRYVYTAYVVAFAARILEGGAWGRALIGGIAGVGMVAAALIVLPRALGGTSLAGGGDAKVVGVAGVLFGWQGALAFLGASAVIVILRAFVFRRSDVSPELPPTVERDLEILRAAAAAGDEDARQALAMDPVASSRMPEATGPSYVVALILAFGVRSFGLVSTLAAWLGL